MVYIIGTPRRYTSQRELYKAPSSLELGTMSRAAAGNDTFNRILGRTQTTHQKDVSAQHHQHFLTKRDQQLQRANQSRSSWALNEIRLPDVAPRKHRHQSSTYERYSQCKSTLDLRWLPGSNISVGSSSSSSSSKCSSGSAIQSHKSLFDLRSFTNDELSTSPTTLQRHGSDRDVQRAKQRASILWLMAKSEIDGRVPDQYQEPFYLDHNGREVLKPWITQRLASGELYAYALANIYGDPSLSNNGHKETLRLLAHKGVQIRELNTENESINETVLMQTNPVRVNAHFVIVECILQLFVREILIPVKVGEVVARFSGVIDAFDHSGNFLPENAELPMSSDPETVALFWINKACDQFNIEITREWSSSDQQQHGSSHMNEPAPFLPSLDELSDMCDGCSVFGLIAFYCSTIVSWRSIVLKENISIADSIHNLQKVQQFCLQYLPMHACFLTLEDFLYLPEPLISNFLAFIADLLYSFEIQPVDCVSAPCLRLDYESEYAPTYSDMPTPSEMRARSLRHHSWNPLDEDASIVMHPHRRDINEPIYSPATSQVYETIAETRRQVAAVNSAANVSNASRRDSITQNGAGGGGGGGTQDANGRIDSYFSTLTLAKGPNHQNTRNGDPSQLNDYYTNLSSQFEPDAGLTNPSPPPAGYLHRPKDVGGSQNTSASETSSLAELSEYSANDSVRQQLSENRRLIERRSKQEKEKRQSVGQDFRQEVLKRLNNNEKKVVSNPDLDTRKSPKTRNPLNSTDDANLTFEIHELNPMRREGTYTTLTGQAAEQAYQNTFVKKTDRSKGGDLSRVDKTAEQFASSATFVKSSPSSASKDRHRHERRRESSDSEEMGNDSRSESANKSTPPRQRQQWGAPVMPMPMAQYPYPAYPGQEWGPYATMYPPGTYAPPNPYGAHPHYPMPPHGMHAPRYPYPMPPMDPNMARPPVAHPGGMFQSPEFLQSMGYVMAPNGQMHPIQHQSPLQQQQQQQSPILAEKSSKSEMSPSQFVPISPQGNKSHHVVPRRNSSPRIPLESAEDDENVDEENEDDDRASSPPLRGGRNLESDSPPIKGGAETFFISFGTEKEKSTSKKSPNTRTTTRPKNGVEKLPLTRTTTQTLGHSSTGASSSPSSSSVATSSSTSSGPAVTASKPKTPKADNPTIVAELYNVKPPAPPRAQPIAFLIEAEDVEAPVTLENLAAGITNGTSHVDPTEQEIQRKKEAMMKQSMKRRAELEKKRLEKEAELASKKNEEHRKREEQERKKEEAAAKRAAILEEYKKRKQADEDAERDARNGIPRSSSTLVLNRGGGATMRPNRLNTGTGNRPRPKSLHGNALEGTTSTEIRLSASRDEIDLMGRPQSAVNTPTGGYPGSGHGFEHYNSSNFYSQEYNGPKLFVKPSQKSNKTLILNAINVVLAGSVNADTNRRVSNVINSCDSKYFLILFRNAQLQYRAIYSYYPEREEDVVVKLDGNGPKRVTNEMIEKFFKYNSGTKNFNTIQTKHLSVTIDAFIIHNHFWQRTGPAAAAQAGAIPGGRPSAFGGGGGGSQTMRKFI